MISIVIPIFNESESISLFLDEVRKQILKLKENFEIICVDDGSTDITLELLKKHKEKYREIKIIKLSRNFGKEIALSCGLDYTKGDIIIIMDADFQHPVSLILELYEAHKAQDCEVVLAKRINRQKENFINKSLAYLFYRIHNKISKVQIPYNVGDCRLISKKVLEQIKNFHETQRFMKGVFAYVGFKTYTIEYEAEERKYGKSNFNIWKLWNLALEGIASFSIVPLRIFLYIGIIVSLISFAFGGYIALKTIIFGIDMPGYASLISAITFLSGIQLIGIGVLGEYLGRNYMESKNRPLYIVEDEY